jgi:hypothetical protein
MYTRYNGTQKVTQVQANLQKVIKDMRKRCGIPREAEVRVEQLECKVQFKVDDKWVYVSAVHTKEDGTGTYEEMLTVDIKLNQQGKPITTVDTEYHPIIDETMQKILDGTYSYGEIVSEYKEGELTVIDEIKGGDVKAVRYDIAEVPELELVQYFKEGKLVFEMEIKKGWKPE